MTPQEIRREQLLEKPLPSSKEAERVTLGVILLDNNLMSQAMEKNLLSDDFYTPMHRRIFKAMRTLYERGDNIDPVLIGEELKKDGSIESIGGISSITNLTYGLPHFSDIYDYVKVIKDKSVARNLIKACNEITSEALAEETEVFETVGKAGQIIFGLLDTQEKKGFRPISESIETSIKEVQARAKAAIDSPYTLRGLSTGFRDLNEKTSGIVSPDLIVVAARPSIGKTTICLNLAENATEDDREAVIGVFSLEMASTLLGGRMLCSNAKVDSHRYANGYLTKDEWGRVAMAVETLSERRIFIEDAPNQTVIELQAQAQRLKAENKRLDLLVIDHLGLVKGDGRYKENRHMELSTIMKGFVNMKKVLGCPIILIHQLSKKVETRTDKKPMLSDLRDSGSIEEDADGVWLLYREDYYKETEENKGIAELIIAKNRNGPTGKVKLAFLKEFSRFENYYGEFT